MIEFQYYFTREA